MKKLIRYLLTVKVDARPDIFQVSHLAFELAGQPNPVQNLHNSPIPTFSSLSESLGSPLASDTVNGASLTSSKHPQAAKTAAPPLVANAMGQLATATKGKMTCKRSTAKKNGG